MKNMINNQTTPASLQACKDQPRLLPRSRGMAHPLWIVDIVLKFILILIFFSLSIPYPTLGSPFRNMPITVTQPNGLVVECFASGDEFYRRIHDANNYTIVRDSLQYYVYGMVVNGELVPSPYVVGIDDPAAAGLTPGLGISAKKMEAIMQEFKDFIPVGQSKVGMDKANTLSHGAINSLVVFVRFQGQADFTAADTTALYQMFNDSTPGANSQINYYREVSDNKLTIRSHFFPTPGGAIISYLDAHSISYYLPNTLDTAGYAPAQRWQRERELVTNIISSIATIVPAGLNIDKDNDNKVDNLTLILNTTAEPQETGILWHHYTWHDTIPYGQIQGKDVHWYIIHPKRSLLLPQNGVGTICHEMGHNMGFPDFYHRSIGIWGNLRPVESWDLMSLDRNPPQYIGSYAKWKYGGWIDEIPVIHTHGTYQLNPLAESTDNNCFKLMSQNSSTIEYFVIEHRRVKPGFESTIPGDGILIYRINDTVTRGNLYPPCDEVYIYRPDGTLTNNGLPLQAAFSQNAGRTDFNDITNPRDFLSNDPELGHIKIRDISELGNTMSFYVHFDTDPLQADIVYSGNFVPKYFRYQNNNPAWYAIAARSNEIGKKWSFHVYDDTLFNNAMGGAWVFPIDDRLSVDSNKTVVFMQNDASVASHIRGARVTTTDRVPGNIQVHFTNTDGQLNLGLNDSITMGADELVKVYNVPLTYGVYQFRLEYINPNSDLDIMAAYGDIIVPANPFWDGWAYSRNIGAGVSEWFHFNVTEDKDYGFAVVKNDNTEASFRIIIEKAGTWTGANGIVWNDSLNWSARYIPNDPTKPTDVIIPQTVNQPVIFLDSLIQPSCRHLTINNGASLKITAQSLVVYGDANIHGKLIMDPSNDTTKLNLWGGNIYWHDGSEAWLDNKTRITYFSEWHFEAGSKTKLNKGMVYAMGPANKIYAQADSSYFNTLRIFSPHPQMGSTVELVPESDKALVINNRLIIDSNCVFLVNSLFPLKVRGELLNQGTFRQNSGTFFAEDNMPNLKMNDSDYFHHLMINTNNLLDLQSDVSIHGNFTILNGGFDVNGFEMHVGGNWDNQLGPAGFQEDPSMVIFDGLSPSQILTSEEFDQVVIDKGIPGIFQDIFGVTMQNDVLVFNGLDIVNGVLDVNRNLLFSLSDLNVRRGRLTIPDSSVVGIGNDQRLWVSDSGTIEVMGTAANTANVTRYGGGGYHFEVEGEIKAQYGTFQFMRQNGVNIHDGAFIDTNFSFHYCTFTNGIPGGTLLTINNDQVINVNSANFPANIFGSASNVTKIIDQGHVVFNNALGAFAGEDFDLDPFNHIDWNDTVEEVSAVPSSICPGQSSQLLVNLPGIPTPLTYVWSPVASLSSSSIHNPVATPDTTTLYTVIVTNLSGYCDTFEILVTVNALDALTLNAIPPELCEGDSAILIASGALTYTWGHSTTTDSMVVVYPASTTSYALTATNSFGCSSSISTQVDVHTLPVPYAGDDVTIAPGDTTILCGTVVSLAGPFILLWQPSASLSDSTVFCPSAFPSTTTTYTFMVTDSNGCQAQDQVVVTIGALASIHGQATYNGSIIRPLRNVTVSLMRGNDQVAEVLTANGGYYQIQNVTTGLYRLELSTNNVWGGVNATDALLILYHFVDQTPLSGLRASGADVNASGFVNAVDALLCSKRFTGYIQSFPAGDWVFDRNESISINAGDNIVNIKGLCYGDVNASFFPPTKQSASLHLKESGATSIKKGEVLRLPILMDQPIEAGSISLVLNHSPNFRIQGISKHNHPEWQGIFHDDGTQLRLAWYSISPITFNSGDTFMILEIQPDHEAMPLSLQLVEEESEISDGYAQRMSGIGLLVPKVECAQAACFLGYNIPNPFTGITQIPYELYEEGYVTLRVYNLFGEVIATLIHDVRQDPGSYQLAFDCSGCQAGAFSYGIEFRGKTSHYRKSRLMVVAK